MIDSTSAKQHVRESFVGFPSRVTAAYLAFAESGDLPSLDVVVLGVLQFYLPKKPAAPLDSLPGTTRLVDDLGCDSLTLVDIVFMVEGVFDIKLDDAELARILTLDDLRALVRRLLTGAPSPA